MPSDVIVKYDPEALTRKSNLWDYKMDQSLKLNTQLHTGAELGEWS
jgi:hypothetical protein